MIRDAGRPAESFEDSDFEIGDSGRDSACAAGFGRVEEVRIVHCK